MKKQRILGTITLIVAFITIQVDRTGDFVLISGALLGLGISLFFIPFSKKVF